MAVTQRISPCLWFAEGAEEAARLNGGPLFTFNEAISLEVRCTTQEEILADADSPGAQRAMSAMLRMKKPDLAALRRAYAGR